MKILHLTQDKIALMYNFAAVKYHGEFACLNKLPENYQKLFNETNKLLENNKSPI